MKMELMFGNNQQLFKNIPDNSVDLVLTDPPYNISTKNNFSSMNRSGIEFGEWDHNADLFSYIYELPRITKQNATVIVFNDWKNLGDIGTCLEKNGFIVKDLFRWIKSNPMPRNRDRRYITDYEMAIIAVNKNAKWTFNRFNDKYERAEFICPIVSRKQKFHPTQKPVALMEHLIKIHSNENDVVLDPFMGSGSTGVACLNTNREFIGMELDEKYFNIAEQRMEHAR